MRTIRSLARHFASVFAAMALLIAAPAVAQTTRYLGQEPDIAGWEPAQPQPGDRTDADDLGAYFSSRPLALPGTRTLATAQDDDVLDAPKVALRFSDALGGALTPQNAKHLLDMMTLILGDDTQMLQPLKRPVANGGRVRPYVRFPDQPACRHDIDDSQYQLNTSGSYPSGHATYGWMWGLVLSAMVPERADRVMQRAYDFGQSRLVCGFHYPSDLTAGRLAASALFAALMTDRAFNRDFGEAKKDVRAALNLAPIK